MQQQEAGGFNFENSRRNAVLESSLAENGFKYLNPRKTGTTIAGLIYKDGVILGADTRTTDDMMVADKNCEKIHCISPTIYGCGAGVAADALLCSQMIAASAQLHSLNTGRRPPVAMMTRQLKQTLFRYQGQVSCSLIVGGVDDSGPQLYSVYPHGSSYRLPYVTMGSGAAAAAAVLEDRFKPYMELQDALQVLQDAVLAGILCDLVSGGSVDVCVITETGADLRRGVERAAVRGNRTGDYRYKRGTTVVLTKSTTNLRHDLVHESVQTTDQD
ncbi:unnamed protein product [Knipowitschia caucasica]